MSVSCQKQITINVKSGVHTDLYWTMDEAGTADRIDKVQGVILRNNPSGGAALEYLGSAAGLISNAVNCFVGPPGGTANAGLATSPLSNPLVVQLGTGFSWIGWFNVGADFDAAQANWFLFFGGPVFPYRVTLSLHTGGVIQMISTDGVNTDFTNWGANYVIGAWTFYHIWFDPADNRFRMDINNSGVPVVSASTYTILSTAGQNGQIFFQVPSAFGTGFNLSYDETGYKLNRKLTAAEATSLFNGGAGKTWPAVSSIFS